MTTTFDIGPHLLGLAVAWTVLVIVWGALKHRYARPERSPDSPASRHVAPAQGGSTARRRACAMWSRSAGRTGSCARRAA
jgi:hypothetical protein